MNTVESKVFPLCAVRAHVVVEVGPIALLFLNHGTAWGKLSLTLNKQTHDKPGAYCCYSDWGMCKEIILQCLRSVASS